VKAISLDLKPELKEEQARIEAGMKFCRGFKMVKLSSTRSNIRDERITLPFFGTLNTRPTKLSATKQAIVPFPM
jgi:hypothetical protein